MLLLGCCALGVTFDVSDGHSSHSILSGRHPIQSARCSIKRCLIYFLTFNAVILFPEGFISLSEAPFVEFVRLSRLSPLESETLMKSCLRWPGSLSTELIKLVESKAQGNPLMIKEV